MPRLFHRPPVYRRHESTNQAVVSFFGERLYLGPYGSPTRHQRYQVLLKKWEQQHHQGAVDKDQFANRDGWSRKYLNKQVNRIRGMFQWAVPKEIVDAEVATSLRQLSGLKKGRTRARETAPVTCVSDKIVDATIAALPAVVADMVRLQRLTSARPGEICSISVNDVDRSNDVWLYRPASTRRSTSNGTVESQ